MKAKTTLYLVAFFLCMILAENFGEYRINSTIVDGSADTVIVRDTFLKPSPVDTQFVTNRIVKLAVIRDTVSHTATDTLHDSILVSVPITRKTYEDSTYKAVISGYNPILESMIVKSRVITQTRLKYVKKGDKWGLGVQAGYGFNTKEFSPYIGIGVSYSILTW